MTRSDSDMAQPIGQRNRPPGTSAGEGAITMEVIRDPGKLLSLREEWNDLARKSSATIFQTHEWLSLWWKHFGAAGNRTLHILIFRHDEKLIGIIPLFLDAQILLGFRVYKRLRLLGCGVTNKNSHTALADSGPSDFLDFIILPEFRSRVVAMFLGYVLDHPFLYDEVELVNILDEGIAKREIPGQLEALGLHCEVTRMEICPRLRTPPSLEQYLKGLNPHVRRRLLQAKKIFARDDKYTIETVTNETLPCAFSDLVKLHQLRWNRLGYPGLFYEPRFERFQEEMIRSCWDQGWIWFKTVRLEGVRIAARMIFQFNGRMYDYTTGFDDRSPGSKHRPGLAILLEALEDAITLNYHSVELLRGDEAYKFELTSEVNYIWNIRFYNSKTHRSIRSRLAHVLRMIEHVAHMLLKERLLLVVQEGQHGFPVGAFQYIRFRFGNLLRKLFPVERDK